MSEEIVFGTPVTTPKGILLDVEFLCKRNPDPEFGKDRFMVQFGIPKDANLTKLNKAIMDLKEEVFPDVDVSALDMPLSDGDEKEWGPGKGKWNLKPKAKKKKPIVVDEDREDVEDVPSDVDAGMIARLRVTPMAFNKSKKVRGITLGLKMVQVYTNEKYAPIAGRETAADAFADDDDEMGDV